MSNHQPPPGDAEADVEAELVQLRQHFQEATNGNDLISFEQFVRYDEIANWLADGTLTTERIKTHWNRFLVAGMQRLDFDHFLSILDDLENEINVEDPTGHPVKHHSLTFKDDAAEFFRPAHSRPESPRTEGNMKAKMNQMTEKMRDIELQNKNLLDQVSSRAALSPVWLCHVMSD